MADSKKCWSHRFLEQRDWTNGYWNLARFLLGCYLLTGKQVDTLSPQERSHRMRLVRSTGSRAEMTVRRLVHSLGYRFRLHDRRLPGSPDLVFASRKKVVFVHGCFWHRHAKCPNARLPKSRLEFWLPKLEQNRLRDRRVKQLLTRLGWRYFTVWECEVKDAERLKRRIIDYLEG